MEGFSVVWVTRGSDWRPHEGAHLTPTRRFLPFFLQHAHVAKLLGERSCQAVSPCYDPKLHSDAKYLRYLAMASVDAAWFQRAGILASTHVHSKKPWTFSFQKKKQGQVSRNFTLPANSRARSTNTSAIFLQVKASGRHKGMGGRFWRGIFCFAKDTII